MAPPRTTPTPTKTRLVPAKRGAAETGVPYSSWRDAVHRGEIPLIRIGRAWYHERTDIDRWIASRKETA